MLAIARGYDHEGVVLGPIPGGGTSSEALDAMGNRCNHLSHADESHHVERRDSRVKDFDRVRPTVMRPKQSSVSSMGSHLGRTLC